MPYSRAFLSFWASREIAALGNGILFVALLAWTYNTEEKAIVVSIAMVALLLPPFLLSPLANHLVQGPRSYPVAILARIATIAALWPLLNAASAKDQWLVLAAVFAAAIPITFLRTSNRSLARSLVERERRNTAKQTLADSRLLTLIVAPAAAAVIYDMRDFSLSALPACAAVAIGALALSTLLMLLARPSHWDIDTAEKPSLAAELALLQQGMLTLWQRPLLRSMAALQLSATLLAGGLAVVQVALMIWGAFTSAENVGFVLAAQALGIAAVAVGRRFLRSELPANGAIAAGLGLISAGIFGLPVSDGLRIAVPCGFMIGLGLGLSGSTFRTFAQTLAPVGKEHAVRAALAMAMEAMAILSAILLGPLTDGLSTRYAASLLSVLAALLALYSFGAAPNPDAMQTEGEVAHTTSDTLYDVGVDVPAATPAR